MEIATIGLDLAKRVFQVDAANTACKVVVHKAVQPCASAAKRVVYGPMVGPETANCNLR